MKKISVFLALIILTVSTAYAGEYKTDFDFGVKPDNFTEQIADDGHFVKYDAENADIYALNTDGSGGQSGMVELESTLSGMIDISFDFTVTENHTRLKMFFENDKGEQIHMHQLYKSRAGVYLTNSTVSAIDSAAKKGKPGEKMYVKMQIDTNSKTAAYSFGVNDEAGVVWSTQKSGVALESVGAENVNLKKIVFKNEYSKCDIHIDNLSVSGEAFEDKEEEDGGDDVPENQGISISFPEEEDKDYVVIYSKDFSSTEGIGQNETDDGHYAKIDEGNSIGMLKNTDGKDSLSIELELPAEYKKDGLRVAYTFYANAEHNRMKSFYYNGAGEVIHQNNILQRSGTEVVVANNFASMIDTSLNKYETQTPGRVELEFDFTNKVISYRTATISGGKWVYGKKVSGKQFYSAGADTELSLSKIAFSNEYGICDMYIDDVRVSLPKAKPEARNIRIEGMRAEYPITKDILTGKFDYFEENGVDKGECELSWVVSDSSDFSNESIVGSGETLELTGLEGKYIKFRVVPVSVAGVAGKAYEAGPIGPVVLIADTNTPPEAKEFSIKGETTAGNTVSADYKYYDVDFDDEGDSIIKWYTVKDDEEELVKTGSKDDLTLFIKEEYAGSKIKLVVTVKSKNQNEEAGTQVVAVTEEISESAAYKDYIALTLSPESGSEIDERIYLPAKGENGSQISWESSEPDTLASDGSVKRGTRDTDVTLTATISSDGIEYKKEFKYTVLKKKISNGGGGGGSSYSGGGYSVAPVVKEEAPTANVNAVAPVFCDLQGFEWAEKEINTLYEKGIVSGDGKGNFSPERYVTRAEFVKMVVDFFNIEGSEDITFSDVEREDWYYESVKKAVASGVVSGMSVAYFGADERISRQDMAVIISRIKGFANSEVQEAFLDDEMISDYAKGAVYAMREEGIISGRDDGCFDPLGSATRAEAAKIICISGN